MGMRYVLDDLEKAIIRSGVDDIGSFVNEAVKEKLEKLEREKKKEEERRE